MPTQDLWQGRAQKARALANGDATLDAAYQTARARKQAAESEENWLARADENQKSGR